MSGTAYSQTVQQQVTVNFQAWLPAPPAPIEGSPWPPNALIGTQPRVPAQLSQYQQVALNYQAWLPPFLPMPETVNWYNQNLTIGAGATFTTFSKPVSLERILAAWITPDPPPTLPIFQLQKRFTPAGLPGPVITPGNAVTPPHNVLPNGAVPVYIVVNSPTGGIVPQPAQATTIVNGGQAIVVATGPINGGLLINPPNAASQGVTAENINVDLTKPPLAGDSNAYGTTFIVAAAGTYTLPALAPGVQVWVNAVTAGHRVTCMVW